MASNLPRIFTATADIAAPYECTECAGMET